MNTLSKLILQRARLATDVRAFFAERHVIEVSTPVLSQSAVTDPNIESFAVTVDEKSMRYLRTSPEFPLKRLLSEDIPDVFELGPVFRNGERGRWHNPEFTLLEWYRQGVDMQGLIDEVVALIKCVCDGQLSAYRVKQYRYFDAFAAVAGVDVSAFSANELERLAHAKAHLHPPRGDMDTDQWLDFLFSTLVQPTFDADDISVITHYPASQAALARIDPVDESTALRFEVFVGSVELANGFQELNDASEQAQRFTYDNELRRARGQTIMPVDDRFLERLDLLPDCSGVALGFDRLLMLAYDLPSISDALPIDWSGA